MAGNITIIVVLGSRKAVERLLASHKSAVDSTETRTLLVAGYPRFHFHTLPADTRLKEIEQKVTAQIQNLGALNANVGGIVFFCSEKYRDPKAFPFHDNTRFLDLSGNSLFEKLTVVPLIPDLDATAHFKALAKKGVPIVKEGDPNAVLTWVLNWVAKGTEARRNMIQNIYGDAAMRVRRNGRQAVILLVGNSAHGKSKTINRLVGQELLYVGRGTLGSTTKVIQRVQVHSTSKELSSEITVAFDDTPSLEDNTFDHRELNTSLLHTYKLRHFPDIYPNVILLVVAWDSIIPDAHKKPDHFESALGKTIYALYCLNLVDDQRTNIVVVVTKSMSSPDYKDTNEKNAQWGIEEGRRRGIITDLQRKLFPRSSPWEIVFIENGGGTDMKAKFPVLPDGQLSHQNLYDAIHNIIKRPSADGSLDLVGIQALQVLTGAAPLAPLAKDPEVLVATSMVKLKEIPKPLPQPPRDVNEDLASIYLGVTYDDALGTFGRTNVLEKQQIVPRPEYKLDDFRQMDNPFTLPLRHYSSDWAFRAATAISKNSQFWILQCTTQVIVGHKKLSKDMLNLIRCLPPWSPGEQPKYAQFFTDYGTHVLTQLVLGGTVRAIVDSTKNGQSVMIFRDGGASVAADLTLFLERCFPPSRSPFESKATSDEWKATSDKWIAALKKEPVFCPDHELTKYTPIYELTGLTPAQQTFLEKGYKSYMASRPQNDKTWARKGPRTEDESLQREFNLAEAVKLLLDAAWSQAWNATFECRTSALDGESSHLAVTQYGCTGVTFFLRMGAHRRRHSPSAGYQRGEKPRVANINISRAAGPLVWIWRRWIRRTNPEKRLRASSCDPVDEVLSHIMGAHAAGTERRRIIDKDNPPHRPPLRVQRVETCVWIDQPAERTMSTSQWGALLTVATDTHRSKDIAQKRAEMRGRAKTYRRESGAPSTVAYAQSVRRAPRRVSSVLSVLAVSEGHESGTGPRGATMNIPRVICVTRPCRASKNRTRRWSERCRIEEMCEDAPSTTRNERREDVPEPSQPSRCTTKGLRELGCLGTNHRKGEGGLRWRSHERKGIDGVGPTDYEYLCNKDRLFHISGDLN
ncbi:hypothetical protein C8J57DRAFT_1228475 [Mycena rebaudengoi]|nr:hypothetical protein C8J57DRAFT_1228475 [Mycena rebaudengoi]